MAAPHDPSSTPLTYSSYLRLDELLALQRTRSESPEHDELLFIIIHQVYELWFKEVLHELDQLVEHLDADHPDLGDQQLKRVLKIVKTLVAQIDVLETMTPLGFESFRSFLASASGFESAQFREIELLLGFRPGADLARFADDEAAAQRLDARIHQPTLWDAFVRHLARRGQPIPETVLERDVTAPAEESAAVQEVLVELYRGDPAMATMCESLLDLDEGLQEWRYRHVMMVQRTIGSKRGTGGSDGVEYLRSTLFRPAFPDLWAIRSRF